MSKFLTLLIVVCFSTLGFAESVEDYDRNGSMDERGYRIKKKLQSVQRNAKLKNVRYVKYEKLNERIARKPL